jgi:aromatic-L-amino-acid decarboxylase
MAGEMKQWIEKHDDFEMLAPATMNVLCFRFNPGNVDSDEKLNEINEQLLHEINQTGEIYMTHTKLSGQYTLRLVIAQTDVEKKHVEKAWEVILRKAEEIFGKVI